jgi:hypothetical protein
MIATGAEDRTHPVPRAVQALGQRRGPARARRNRDHSIATLIGMWIRLLLQPWWLRTVYYTAAVSVTVCTFLAVLRWQSTAMSAPLPGLALIVIGAVALAGLLAAVVAPWRDRQLHALRDIPTPDQRSQAITAVWRGPAPTDPDVRRTAELLARVRLDAYSKNRRTLMWVYPLLAFAQVGPIVIALGDDQPRKALLPVVIVVTLAWATVSGWNSPRRLRAQIAVLADVPTNSAPNAVRGSAH